jgi:hypothetical protein
MAAPIRTTKKLLLGREIQHMIDTTTAVKNDDGSVGISHARAAALIETSQTRMTALTNGIGTITPGDLTMLATKLGFTDPVYLDVLLGLRRDNHKRGYWSTGHRRAYREDFRLLVDLEQHADLIRAVEVEIVPGLLQCESYASALMTDDWVGEDGVTSDDFVQARLARQEVLSRQDGPLYHAVLSQSCLEREVGGPEVMREQLAHLREISRKRRIRVQVLPFKVRSTVLVVGTACTLLRVPSPGAAGPLEFVYVEEVGEIRYRDSKPVLNAIEENWSLLTASALSLDDSRDFIDHVARTSFSA